MRKVILEGVVKIKCKDGLWGTKPYIESYNFKVEPYRFATPTYEQLRKLLKRKLGAELGAELKKVDENEYEVKAKINARVLVRKDKKGTSWFLEGGPFVLASVRGSSYEELRTAAKEYMNMQLPEHIYVIQSGKEFVIYDE